MKDEAVVFERVNQVLRNCTNSSSIQKNFGTLLGLLELQAVHSKESATVCGLAHYAAGNWPDAELFLRLGLKRNKLEMGKTTSLTSVANFRLSHLCDMRGDTSSALKYLHKAAIGGVLAAQLKLGEYLISKNRVSGLQWIERAAGGNHAEAQHRLGLLYRRGRGGLVESDTEAIHWFTRSAKLGYGPSWNEILSMSKEGRGVAKNAELYRYLNACAASHGDPDALFWLYQRCCKINCACPLKNKMLRASARLGHLEAQLNLACNILTTGSQSQVTEGLLWLFKCAQSKTPKSTREQKIILKAKLYLGLALVIFKG